MDYITPQSVSAGLFGDIHNSRITFSGSGGGSGAAPVVAQGAPVAQAAGAPFPWWLVVIGVFAVLALSEPQRG